MVTLRQTSVMNFCSSHFCAALNYFHFLHSTKNTANVKAKKSPRRDATGGIIIVVYDC